MHFARKFVVSMAILALAGSVSDAQSGDNDKLPALKVGDKVTEFKLESQNDKVVDSTKQFGANGRPAVLLFSRANW